MIVVREVGSDFKVEVTSVVAGGVVGVIGELVVVVSSLVLCSVIVAVVEIEVVRSSDVLEPRIELRSEQR